MFVKRLMDNKINKLERDIYELQDMIETYLVLIDMDKVSYTMEMSSDKLEGINNLYRKIDRIKNVINRKQMTLNWLKLRRA